MIRQATHDDIDAIVEMARKFYATTSYAEWAEFCPDSAGALAATMIDSGTMLLADDGDKLLGMVGVFVVPFMFNREKVSAHEVIWWVEPEARSTGAGVKLLDAVEPMCKEIGVGAIQMMHLSNSPPQAGALYESRGYKHSETSYTKVI